MTFNGPLAERLAIRNSNEKGEQGMNSHRLVRETKAAGGKRRWLAVAVAMAWTLGGGSFGGWAQPAAVAAPVAVFPAGAPTAFGWQEAADAGAAPAAQDPAPADAGAGAPAATDVNPPPGEPAKEKEGEMLLVWLVKALGWEYVIVFLALSFVFVALCIMNMLSARRDQVCPQHLVDGFESLLDEKKYQEAYELSKADGSFLGNVLSSGLARLANGYDHALEAMQEVGQDESMKLQHRLSHIGLIGTISPMVGLFGTVDGMIRAFFAIATGGGSPDPQKLADGISIAWLTTGVGLAIAIPASAVFNILRTRVERLELEVGIASGNLMGRFEKVGQKKDA
ncbi:MAG: MotA/TolQ/ExbB proton channel family protein [Planctomycetota bacterium]